MGGLFLGNGSFLSSMSALAGGLVTETVEFWGADVPAGWSVSDGAYLSPEYSNSVSRIALSYGAAGGQVGTAQLFAIDHASSAETQIALVNTLTAGVAFDFPGSSDYRRFWIATDGLALTSFSATWPDTRPDAPSNVVATALTTDSLEVSWDAVEGAVGYRVSIWTNVVVGASEGTVAWDDSLPGATNQLLSCEQLVTNRLDWIVNLTEGWQTCAETEARVLATHAMPESTAVDYVPAEQIRIAPGEVLYLKWTFHPPAKGSSALMAIDDLAVRFKVPEQGFLMRFVKHQANEVSP